MNYVIGRLMVYAEANLDITKFESAKLRFMLEVIFLFIAQLVTYTIFFAYIGKLTEFLILAVVMMCIRPFSSGLHFKNFMYCFILTFAILAAIILVLPDVSSTYAVMEAMLLTTVILNVALAPVSKRNSAHSAKSNFYFKILSTMILLVFSFLLLNARDNPYASIIVWMLFIQSVQLIIGKLKIQYDAKIKERQRAD